MIVSVNKHGKFAGFLFFNNEEQLKEKMRILKTIDKSYSIYKKAT